MKRYLLILFSLLCITTSFGQTIIDLNPGGGIRSKTAEDYRKEDPVLLEKLKTDSLLYNDHLTRALNALYRDSIQQAERLLTEALKLRPMAPTNFIVKHYLGRIAIAKGDFRKAISIFTPLLKDRPESRDVRFDRASCFLEIKNTKAALEDCEILFQAELTHEEKVKALFLRSACYTESRHPKKAKNDLEEILTLDPSNASAQILLAFAYEQLGQPQEALNRLNLFVNSHPQSVEGLIARAELEQQMNLMEIARADLDKAITLDPKNPSLYAKRAQLFVRMELAHKAEKDIRRAIDLGYPAEALYPLLPAKSQ